MAKKPYKDRPQENLQDHASINGIVDVENAHIKRVGGEVSKIGFYRSLSLRMSFILAGGLDQVPLLVKKELAHRDVFAWIPVLLGLGVIAYFAMPKEPNGIGLMAVFMVLAGLTWRMRKIHAAFIFCVSGLLFLGGVVVAKLETDRLSTPLLKQAGTFVISGQVTELVPSDKRTRVILRNVLDRGQIPNDFAGVQLSAYNKHVENLQVGDVIQVRARLEPMSGPLLPNGYDFRRVGYFKGLSARGFLLEEAIPILDFSADTAPSFMDRLNKLRHEIADRISQAVPGQGGALAAALLVGQRAGIADDVQEALRNSGLAHILAISGLHMALITSLIFGAVRLCGACAKEFSARHDVKKLAAATALVGALIYLALSGSAISAQRAFLMAAVFLIAILFDRAALTMRNVAISALVILVVQPSSILSPGFQMSFMAVIALVAVYRREGLFSSFKRRFAKRGLSVKALVGTLGLLLTSVVAGFATSPFAIHHFYQTAIYGLLGNLAAMPIVAMLVMPMGIFALILMPFGLELLPLSLMEFGLRYVVSVSKWVSEIDGSVYVYGQQDALVTLMFALCLLVACLLRTKLRFVFAGAFGLLAIVTTLSQDVQSILFISPDGKMIASREPEGMKFFGASRNEFTAGIWMRAVGDSRDVHDTLLQSSIDQVCDRTACSFTVATTMNERTDVSVIRRPEAWFEVCQSDLDMIISPLEVATRCGTASSSTKPAFLGKSTMKEFGAIRLDSLTEGAPASQETQGDLPAQLAKLGLELTRALPRHKRPWN
ncbi:MAG: ComEC/Rec2 family competence protein [Hyphomicrobiales bacterium]